MNLNETLANALYRKMAKEQEEYENWLLNLTPKEILDHAWEYTVRNDIVAAFEDMEMDDDLLMALLDITDPLAEIYRAFSKLETDHMETVRNTIENRARDLRG